MRGELMRPQQERRDATGGAHAMARPSLHASLEISAEDRSA